MPRRAGPFVQGCIYHLYNRGVNRAPIFAADDNYAFLLHKLKALAAECEASILAYCLMPNHYHFVTRQDGEFPLSRLMQRLFGGYTQAFNKQQGRSGPLFEGRFHHILVDRDEYVLHLCRYMHLNPVTAGLVARPEQWPYSNYLEWIDRRPGTLIDRAFVRQYFETPQAYARFVRDEMPPQTERILNQYVLEDQHPGSLELPGC